jgi:hypothetical protein
MLLAFRLIRQNHRLGIFYRSYIPESLMKAAVTEAISTPEKLNRIVDAEGRQRELHRAIVLVAQRQDVGPHRLSLTFAVWQFEDFESSTFDTYD